MPISVITRLKNEFSTSKKAYAYFAWMNFAKQMHVPNILTRKFNWVYMSNFIFWNKTASITIFHWIIDKFLTKL